MTTLPLRASAADPATLDAEETWSRDHLESVQLERLRATLAHAYANVPLYRRKFDAAGVHPDDLRELTDLAKFPFTTKEDLRSTYPFGMFAVPQSQVARVHASSGTTGQPTVVGYTMRRPRPVGLAGGPIAARLRGEGRVEGPQRLRVRPVHGRPRRASPARNASAAPSSRSPAARPSGRSSSSGTSSPTQSSPRRRTC